MNKLAISLALAGIFATAGTANAAFAIDTLPTGVTLVSFTHALGGDNSFSDIYNFQLSGPANLSGVLSNNPVSIPLLGTIVDTSGLSASLFSGLGGVNAASVQGPASSPIGSFGLTQGNFAGLAAGIYHVTISGSVTGIYAGSYSLGLSSTPAVPEAGSYAMLLAGLGLMGAIVRRRVSKREP
ncbi:FxDxF family PEP-CTERM protein [Rhodocyclus tenuis]|uniref:Ice-binding protein C-terminal domain-containing protein n=1 Tax=Rhodocyclus tenuis TaxID=1066 RepID=A0A840G925_RHOTE|nr:FxDxF family PEP-CTERM protein [Rhodocyclus tenuis]MBB4247188.1 hypothetical protein [Rhodocyclus tenuis]MBK1678892.1 hypothetical protein [Rhodocyclus tenuis]